MAAGDPSLTLPASEFITQNSTTNITGISYKDSFATGNSGFMYLSVSDSLGSLSASDSSGKLGGSGSHNITLSASYADITKVLQSLVYIAPASPGSDTISFDLWDQAGIETTGAIPVTIASSAGKTENWTGAVSSDWNTAANWSGKAVPTSGDTVNIASGTPNNPTLANTTLSGETVTLSNSAQVNFNNVTLDSVLQSSGTAANVNIGGQFTIGAHGTLAPQQGAQLFVKTDGSAVPIVNNGVVTAPVGGLLNIDNGGTAVTDTLTIQNNGIISANGGRIDLDFAPPPFGRAPAETLINTGSVEITSGGSLALNGTFSGNSVTFSGKGALGLQVGNAFAGGSKVTGFGPGDQLDLYGLAKGNGALAFAGGVLSLGTSSAVPLSGGLGLGNFESQSIGGNGSALTIAYAPDGGPSGIVQPDITAPASATVAQGSTLSLGGVSISGLGTASNILNISVGSGRLYMNGASGSGTNHVSLSSATPAQIAADLASLAYVPAAGATADTVAIGVSPPAPVASSRSIPITITSGGTGSGLHEPASETVAPAATVAVSGSYIDSFAQHNLGKLFLGISDNSGTLKATDASGNPVPGSGTHTIGLSTDYAGVNAVLKSLTYTAGSAGKDAISFDIWNQAGMETTGTVPVTIAAINKATLANTAGPSFIAAGPTMSSPADFSTVVSQAVAAMSGDFGAPSGAPGGGAGWLPQPTLGGWLTMLFEHPPQMFPVAPHSGS